MSARSRELARDRARDWMSREVGFRLLDARPDDQIIASFPRSGSTWMRTVLCNLVVPWGRANPDVFNALIPGVTIRGALRARSLRAPRLIATHMPYRGGLPRAVYLVRDGRDALVSYYHYRIKRRSARQDVSFEQFVDEHLRGLQGEPWHENVARWIRLGRAEMGDRLHVVRYEDLAAKPVERMGEVVRFLGLDVTDAQLTAALDDASLETMRRVEAHRMAAEVPPERSFYRAGESTAGAGWFDATMLERFASVAREALELAGYPLYPEQRP